MAAALAMPALADAMTGASERARSHRATAAALIDRLSDDQLSLRLDAAAWLAAAELYLDLYPEADLHARRPDAGPRHRARGRALPVLYQILGRVWYACCLKPKPPNSWTAPSRPRGCSGPSRRWQGTLQLLRRRGRRGRSRYRAGHRTRERRAHTRPRRRLVTAWAAVVLAGVLLETGQPVHAVELLLGRASGEELRLIPGGWRASCFELLTRCWLALDRPIEAERGAAFAEVSGSGRAGCPRRRLGRPRRRRRRFHAGDGPATERALALAHAAQEVGAPIEAALSRTLAGRASPKPARTTTPWPSCSAAAAFDACGALRYRQTAEQELGKARPSPPPAHAAG